MSVLFTIRKCYVTYTFLQNGLTADPVTAPDPGCKMLSLDKLNEWILFGYLVCPSQLNSSDQKAWKNALSDCYIVTLFRDEVVNIHAMYIEVYHITALICTPKYAKY